MLRSVECSSLQSPQAFNLSRKVVSSSWTGHNASSHCKVTWSEVSANKLRGQLSNLTASTGLSFIMQSSELHSSTYVSIHYSCSEAFAKLRKATISFVMPVRPHVTTRLPLDGFSWNLILSIFRKYIKNFKFLFKIWHGKRVVYMKTNTKCWPYLAQFFL